MKWDAIIIGAGGAGMMCAIEAARRGRQVLLVDHAQKIGGKILISGGGRCNFTNTGASPAQYVSRNPHFCKSALSRYPSEKFVEMVRAHGIDFHEKKLGQLFCDGSAQQIVQMLQRECEDAGAQFQLGTRVLGIDHVDGEYRLETSVGTMTCTSLVIATGGLSIPRIGATGFGYEIARQFGLDLVDTVPALDGFTFGDVEAELGSATRPNEGASLRALAGISVDCVISCGGKSFRENLLFTHSGLSGPAALQASLHWNAGDSILIDLLPESSGNELMNWFMEKKREGSRALIKSLLSERFANRFAEHFCELYLPAQASQLPLPQFPEKILEAFCAKIRAWELRPIGTVGYGKAEVTRGGVNTDELSSKTMEAKKSPGLYFIGEVVDVTGWLGGYNFQWAWASGWAAGQVI